ncbi:MAG: energy transducer TonB [Bacteroidia bacterium]|nr:energy transducer TonB [Bacteroidia bacterium]NNM22019.1 hypothetical protein [Flavobacteriaceae bacterium]
MLPSVKNEGGANSKVLSKREQKKQINIRWNSGLFFQIGLIASLLVFILILESDWKIVPSEVYRAPRMSNLEENTFLAFRLEEPKTEVQHAPVKKVQERVTQTTLSSTFTTVSNNTSFEEPDLGTSELVPAGPGTTGEAGAAKKDSGPLNMNGVQFVPIFPGCESLNDNEARKQCMSVKINQFIQRRFNTGRLTELETGKQHTVNVMFTVGKDGIVKDLKAQSLAPSLKKEALRVLAKIPEMKPGRHGDREVDVLFMLPIRFNLE